MDDRVGRRVPKASTVVAAALVTITLSAPAGAQYDAHNNSAAAASRGGSAISQASQNGQYLFVFFWKDNDAHSQKMFGVFQTAMESFGQSVHSVGIQITDPNEKAVVERFGISRAPMPLVVAVAPNGAVTKGFPIEFTAQQLREAFVSACTAKCMKALQDRKLVLLCVQSKHTQFSQAALQGVQGFTTDARFAAATEVVTIDPADSAEASFLQALQVDPRTPTAVTVLLAPPGQPVATFVGAVSKEQIVAKVDAGPCAGGTCGPGGSCGPKN